MFLVIWKLFSFHSKETLIIEPEKNASRIESLEQEKVDDEEEGKKDESSCSSEEDEEDDSESEAETGKIWSMMGFSVNCDAVLSKIRLGFNFETLLISWLSRYFTSQ